MDEMKRVWREASLERPEKTPDGREESLLLFRVRKQSESEDGGMRELRDIWGWWGWKTLQREELSVGCSWEQEQMKMKMMEGERNGMREKPDCQDLQKHLKKGRRDCCDKGKQEINVQVCEDRIKKKWRENWERIDYQTHQMEEKWDGFHQGQRKKEK